MSFELNSGETGKSFKVGFNEENFNDKTFREQVFDAALPFGDVKGRQWFFEGVKMSYSETLLTSPAELDWKGDTELITMHFNLQGRISIRQAGMDQAFELAGNQHNLFYGTNAEGKMKFDGLSMKSFLIQFSKDSFFEITKDGNDALKRFAENIITGKPMAFSETNLNIDLPIQTCIHAILSCNYADSLKRMFFFSKTIEMLVLQAESFNRQFEKKDVYVKHDYDKERILFARDYLIKHMEAPPSLPELAKVAGINEYKLKRGFKELFNQTAFAYLTDVRLELAKNDLLEGKKQATQIALDLGYSSLQNFSDAFKRKYGIRPGQVKRGL